MTLTHPLLPTPSSPPLPNHICTHLSEHLHSCAVRQVAQFVRLGETGLGVGGGDGGGNGGGDGGGGYIACEVRGIYVVSMCMYPCICVRAYMCLYVYVYACVCVCVYVCVCTEAYRLMPTLE